MRDQIGVEDLGGTLRLGLYPSKLKRGSKVAVLMVIKKLYNVAIVIVMSLIMASVNNLKKQVLFSQVCHQTTVW